MKASRTFAAAVTALLAGVTFLAGCSGSTAPSVVRTIAKDDAAPPSGVTPSYSTVLLVPDDLVQTVLADVAVEQLPRQDGEPMQTGRYADFEGSNDLAPGEVLVLWYSGQSGSCPSYLRGLRVTAEGDVDVQQSDRGRRACTDDYNPYRQLVVVSEEAVPAPSELPMTLQGEDGSLADDLVVDVYPAP